MTLGTRSEAKKYIGIIIDGREILPPERHDRYAINTLKPESRRLSDLLASPQRNVRFPPSAAEAEPAPRHSQKVEL